MKKLTKAQDLIEDLKHTDNDSYTEIKKNTEEVFESFWGGKRANAGRKPTNGVVLSFQVRVSQKEKEFLDYAREHKLDFDKIMQG